MAHEMVQVGQERADDEEQRSQRRRGGRRLSDEYPHAHYEQSEHRRSQIQILVRALTNPSQQGREPRPSYALPCVCSRR